MVRSWAQVVVVGALAAAALALAPQRALAQQAHSQQELDQIGKRIDTLEARYLQPELITAKFSVDKRFNDGKVAYNLGQYGQASVLFLDVISKTTPQAYVGYAEALYLLGDSLYKQRNFVGARSFLRQLVALGPAASNYQQALKTLLEIAYKTNNYNEINEIYAKLDNQSELSPSLNYLRGKTLFGQKRYAEARAYFDKATQDPQLKPQAAYFAAVTLVSEARGAEGDATAGPDRVAAPGQKVDAEKLKQADARFDAITKLAPSTPAVAGIVNMAFLARGRLAYERGEYEQAIDLYNRLPREDKHFSKAIYEATWALVQLKRYEMAQRNIKILPLTDPDPDMYTRAMLLQADLSLRIQDYDSALRWFDDILSRYDSVRDQINAFEQQHPDLKTFFESLVKEDLRLEIPEGLPTIRTDMTIRTPEQWLTEGVVMNKAKLLLGDLSTVRTDLRESFTILDALEARLGSTTRIQSFPKLSAGKRLAIGVEADLITIRDDLVRREAQLARGGLSGSDAQRLDQLNAELATLKKRLGASASTPDELLQRDAQIASDFKRMRRKLDEVGLMIDERRKALAEINRFNATQGNKLSAKDRAAFDALRDEAARDIEGWEKLRLQLRRNVDVLRQKVGLGDARTKNEAALRDLYQQRLAEAEQLLRQSSTPDGGELAGVRRLRAQIPGLQARISGYNNKIDQLVELKTSQLRERIKNERVMVQGYADTLGLISGSSKGVVAEIVLRNFLTKKEKFNRIILRADVGKIDVLYQRKEDSSRTINELFQSRSKELKRLEETFREVR